MDSYPPLYLQVCVGMVRILSTPVILCGLSPQPDSIVFPAALPLLWWCLSGKDWRRSDLQLQPQILSRNGS